MADIRVRAAIHINGQMETNQEIIEIQEAAIQIGDELQTSTETNQDFAVPIDELKIYLKKMVSELPGGPFDRRDATIFRLLSSIHENKKELCEPNLVAIGPYHHGKESLRTMEEHKWYIFRKFLARNEDVGIEDYLQVMRSIEAEARNCYSETVDLGSDDFVKMMLLDGFFILDWAFMENKRYTCDLCDLGWAVTKILPDLCLLENQVPFFVLHELWAIHNHGVSGRPSCDDHCPLLDFLCPVLENKFSFTPFKPPQKSCDSILHLLHLCYLGVVPDHKPQSQCEKKRTHLLPWSFLWSKLCSKSGNVASNKQSDLAPMDPQYTIPSISELRDAGVKFRRKKNAASMFDLSFANGTFEMPFLLIEASTIRSLWNMVAFEQSRRPWFLPQILSSYLALMDALINTEEDIAILVQYGTLESLCENAEGAATLFNQFERFFVLNHRNHYFHELCEDVRKYSQSTWHRHRARLMHDYFSNPWSIISLVAAGILLILTFVQT